MALRPSPIVRAIKKVLRREGVKTAQLSVVFVTKAKMVSLNKRYLNDPYPTDVLAFDLSSACDKKRRSSSLALVGEIIVSTEAACRQAKAFQSVPQRELMLYVIHGILHLLGFDDHRPRDIKRFRAKEEEILNFLKA